MLIKLSVTAAIVGATLFAIAGTAEPADGKITDRVILAEVSSAIARVGYLCPRLVSAYNNGYVARGIEVRAYCGPVFGEGIYDKLTYRLVFRPDDSVLVYPAESALDY